MQVSQTSQFRRDMKRQISRGKDPEKILFALDILKSGEELPAEYKDHALRGNWKGRRDCHIEPDWILIYRIIEEHEIRLERTGSHSDLF